MSFDGFDVLHFPVAIHQEASSEQRFTDYVVATRRKVIALGTHFKGAIPEKFTPHITVITDRRLSENPHLQACVEKSLACDPVIFRSGYPSLYARYPEGWNDLSRDPNLFTE